MGVHSPEVCHDSPAFQPSMAKVQQALRILSQHLSEARRARLDSVARKRSTHVALLLENITDFGNRNAALRTMEAHGFQTVHSVIEPGMRPGKKLSTRTDAGAKQWLTVRDWKCTKDCVQHLRAAGYKVASSQLNAGKTLYDLSLQCKTAIAFGNEHNGISKELQELSDDAFSLPMWGLVQSYNVSVAVAITLFHCRSELLNVPDASITEEEHQNLILQFYVTSLGKQKAEQILTAHGIDISQCFTSDNPQHCYQ